MAGRVATGGADQTVCSGCGGCCTEGGPALHGSDLPLVRRGPIRLADLITLRKGELAHHPLQPSIAPTTVELVKLRGVGASWSCLYFDQGEKRCTIYAQRPEACRVLQCWQPAKLVAMVEKDVLTRLDILGKTHPIMAWVAEHELLCPCPDLQELVATGHCSVHRQEELLQLVRVDLQFRHRVNHDMHLKVSEEMFYFGRPVFQLLLPFGVGIAETAAGIILRWPK